MNLWIIKSNQIKSNQIKSNQIKSNQIKSNQIKSNQIKSNQIKSKTFLLATLCVAAALLSCKKDDKVDPVDTQVVADFTFTQGTAGAVTFKNASKNATSYAWDFGDGNKATEENPTHTYTKDSTYTVKLTATNADGSADKTATVTIDNTVTTAPITIDIADLTQLVLPKNSPNGVVIWKLAATVANTDETPVFSITSQNPAGVLGLKGNKIVLADTSAADYATNTELTGEIQATVGGVMATATFTISITDGAGIYIPDAKFKAVLLKNTALNTDEDKEEISVAEAQVYPGAIEANNLGITDATGIEYFTNLDDLNLSGNALTDIDVSKNSALTSLILSGNQFQTLDISNNTALTVLIISDSKLTALDVSQNTALASLNLSINQLTEIDVSNNAALITLRLDVNQFQTIDISRNTALKTFDLNGNQITALDVSRNTALTFLSVGNNQLQTIDISKNKALTRLSLEKNRLTALDVSQNTALFLLQLNQNATLTKVNLANGHNNKITIFNLLENPNLTCVQVDDPSAIPSAWEGKYDKDKVKFQTEVCSN